MGWEVLKFFILTHPDATIFNMQHALRAVTFILVCNDAYWWGEPDMLKAVMDWGKCRHCRECTALSACPTKAIFRMDGDTFIDGKYCYGCGACVEECIGDAIDLRA